jgi:hypothetical protein
MPNHVTWPKPNLAWDIGLRVALTGDHQTGAEVRYTQMEEGLIYDHVT